MKNHSGGDKPETDIQQLHNKCATHTHRYIYTHTQAMLSISNVLT